MNRKLLRNLRLASAFGFQVFPCLNIAAEKVCMEALIASSNCPDVLRTISRPTLQNDPEKVTCVAASYFMGKV